MINDTNIIWHEHEVTRSKRESLNGHKGCVIWFSIAFLNSPRVSSCGSAFGMVNGIVEHAECKSSAYILMNNFMFSIPLLLPFYFYSELTIY